MENCELFLNALTKSPQNLPSTDDECRVGILWECSLHWVFKLKWGGKSYRIPIKNKKLIKTVEPHGVVMFHLLELCEQCHPFQKYGYTSSLNWFWCIIRFDLISQSYSHKRSKTDKVSDGRDEIKKLRKGENPFSKSDEPHLWRLMEQSKHMMPSNKYSAFAPKYWEPFIKSYCTWLSAIESPDWKSVILAESSIRYRPGRGRGTIKIDLLKNVNLESLPDKDSSP